ncbi:hypothetical protein CDAR_236031 [Caerostris darwini]|uniref:Uncharacterized protein n=1 Tax=Caerostris darwini TaxID=1538125 RepID=A0AAV4UGQ4_9ARAC|nr:hypothetical protein CDAR_236031 [Caerostris darwini]
MHPLFHPPPPMARDLPNYDYSLNSSIHSSSFVGPPLTVQPPSSPTLTPRQVCGKDALPGNFRCCAKRYGTRQGTRGVSEYLYYYEELPKWRRMKKRRSFDTFCCTDIRTQSMFEEISISAQHKIRFKEQKNYDPHRVLSFGSPHTQQRRKKIVPKCSIRTSCDRAIVQEFH